MSRAKRVLGDMTLNSKSLDELYQAGKLTIDEARVLAKNAEWKSADGRTIYPPNEGYHNGFKEITLKKSDQIIIDRYGDPCGKFAFPLGEAEAARALPPSADFSAGNYHIYRVENDISVKAARVTPLLDQAGGASQYKLSDAIKELKFDGLLTELRR